MASEHWMFYGSLVLNVCPLPDAVSGTYRSPYRSISSIRPICVDLYDGTRVRQGPIRSPPVVSDRRPLGHGSGTMGGTERVVVRTLPSPSGEDRPRGGGGPSEGPGHDPWNVGNGFSGIPLDTPPSLLVVNNLRSVLSPIARKSPLSHTTPPDDRGWWSGRPVDLTSHDYPGRDRHPKGDPPRPRRGPRQVDGR